MLMAEDISLIILARLFVVFPLPHHLIPILHVLIQFLLGK